MHAQRSNFVKRTSLLPWQGVKLGHLIRRILNGGVWDEVLTRFWKSRGKKGRYGKPTTTFMPKIINFWWHANQVHITSHTRTHTHTHTHSLSSCHENQFVDTFRPTRRDYCLLKSEAIRFGRVWEQPATSIFFRSEDKSKQYAPKRYLLRRHIPKDRNVNDHPRENVDCNVIFLKDILVS
jgi:hypothetical protein